MRVVQWSAGTQQAAIDLITRQAADAGAAAARTLQAA
jgi:hypothetical protein